MFLTSLELEARKKAKTPQNYEFELSLKVGYLQCSRIRYIFVRIRILGSVPLTNGSASMTFRMEKNCIFSYF
jgi:hypothetical protein